MSEENVWRTFNAWYEIATYLSFDRVLGCPVYRKLIIRRWSNLWDCNLCAVCGASILIFYSRVCATEILWKSYLTLLYRDREIFVCILKSRKYGKQDFCMLWHAVGISSPRGEKLKQIIFEFAERTRKDYRVEMPRANKICFSEDDYRSPKRLGGHFAWATRQRILKRNDCRKFRELTCQEWITGRILRSALCDLT